MIAYSADIKTFQFWAFVQQLYGREDRVHISDILYILYIIYIITTGYLLNKQI